MKVTVALALTVAFTFAGCASGPETNDAAPKRIDAPEAAAKERELRVARSELVVATAEAKAKALERTHQLEQAVDEADKAKTALAVFTNKELPNKTASAKIGLDSARYSVDEARAELDELVAMYSAEEFAQKTKELVLQRGRRRLEIAERRLAVETAEFAIETEDLLPRRGKELANAAREAERKVERMRLEHEIATLQQQLAIEKAQKAVLDLEQQLAKLQRGADRP